MKIILTVSDRVVFNNILRQKGSIADIRILGGIIDKAAFSEEEQAELGLSKKGGGVSWSKDKEVELDFSDEERVFLENSIKLLDSSGGVTLQTYSLCLKIIEALSS